MHSVTICKNDSNKWWPLFCVKLSLKYPSVSDSLHIKLTASKGLMNHYIFYFILIYKWPLNNRPYDYPFEAPPLVNSLYMAHLPIQSTFVFWFLHLSSSSDQLQQNVSRWKIKLQCWFPKMHPFAWGNTPKMLSDEWSQIYWGFSYYCFLVNLVNAVEEIFLEIQKQLF